MTLADEDSNSIPTDDANRTTLCKGKVIRIFVTEKQEEEMHILEVGCSSTAYIVALQTF